MIALLTLSVALAAEPTAEELLTATDDAFRGSSSHALVEMYVKTDRYERTMRMELWSKGTDKTLIRVLEPAKDAGTVTLKVGENIWNHLPRIDRTMKLPPGMMSGSWMGSHFTNDDLVKESRLAEDYTYEITARPADNDGNYEITLVPKPDAPVVWGKQVLDVSPAKIPVEARFYDEKGALVRTMRWSEVKRIGDRDLPTVMTLIPADAPQELTRMSYETIEFDLDLSDGHFSLQSLK